MKLSITIVNYNVEYFLEHCLLSVRDALKGIESEVFVVDNNSVDGSVAMLKKKFPEVKLIENHDNPGFAKANNQAIRLATGEYVLLLNPDTLVQEDTFQKCIDFMDSHPDAGGLGVKILDGQGKLAKSSKRGFPTPWVCFCKMSGLSSLFPHSKKYAGYYMGHLSYNETNKIDVLSGAFMFMRHEALDKSGLLDETFFMYGEDIDLSYRLTLAGYNNYYLPETSIIHYQGESTKKGSLNYVYTFYNAMDIFAKKHLSKKQTWLFSLVIKLAIWARASLSFIKRILGNLFLPLVDFVCIYLGFILVERFWAVSYWGATVYYPSHYRLVAVPIYILILLLSTYMFGGYEKKFTPHKLLYGVGFGMVGLLVFYSLMPASVRYSRAMVLLGCMLSFVILFIIRLLRHRLINHRWALNTYDVTSYAIVGDKAECERVSRLLKDADLSPNFIGMVSATEGEDKDFFLGNVRNLNEIIRIYKVDEVIFCSKAMNQGDIIRTLAAYCDTKVKFSIAPDSDFIIASSTINTPSEIYVMSVDSISSESNRRKKRLFDVFMSLAILVFYIFLLFIFKHKLSALKHAFEVLFAKKTFVGYNLEDENHAFLPKLKPSLFLVSDNILSKDQRDKVNLSPQTIHRLNLMYCRNYKIGTDFDIVIGNLRRM